MGLWEGLEASFFLVKTKTVFGHGISPRSFYAIKWILTTRLLQWLSWIFASQERKKERKTRAAWLKRHGLAFVRATPLAEFDDISALTQQGNLSMRGTFFIQLLTHPRNRGLQPHSKKTYHLNSCAITSSIWSFRTPKAFVGEGPGGQNSTSCCASLAYGAWAIPTLIEGHHSDRALRCLEVRETFLGLVSPRPRIQASPQTLQTIFCTH